jgi:hypothetical protein
VSEAAGVLREVNPYKPFMIEIYDRTYVDPEKVQGVYLRELHGQGQLTVVLLDTHEIRLPGDLAESIKNQVEKAWET